jgi:hypothetical protein
MYTPRFIRVKFGFGLKIWEEHTHARTHTQEGDLIILLPIFNLRKPDKRHNNITGIIKRNAFSRETVLLLKTSRN